MKRRRITCRRLIDAGSHCPSCQPRPADPGRLRGRRNQARRARLTAAQGGRCAYGGIAGVPLERHHLDHNHANDDPADEVMGVPPLSPDRRRSVALIPADGRPFPGAAA